MFQWILYSLKPGSHQWENEFLTEFSWEIVFSHWCEHILISHWQFLSDILAWNSVRKISKRFDIFLIEFLKIKGSDLRVCKKNLCETKI